MANRGFFKSWRAGLGMVLALVLISFGVMGCRGESPVKEPFDLPLEMPSPFKANRLETASVPQIFADLAPWLETVEPQVKILNPRPDEVIQDTTLAVRFQVKDLPIYKDANWQLGPHLHLILDNEPYRPVYNVNEPFVLEGLTPGTHTLRVFASKPWHESFKNQGAYDQVTFHVFTKTFENVISESQPSLTYSRPTGVYGAEPVMVDFYLTNAPLHMIAQESTALNLTDWRVRLTVNGDTQVFETWQPIYIQGLKPGQNWVQLELIDDLDQPIENAFNNTARLITYEPGGTDTLSKLVRGELTVAEVRGIVDPDYVPPAPPASPIIVEPAPIEEPSFEEPSIEEPTLTAPPVEAPLEAPVERSILEHPVDKPIEKPATPSPAQRPAGRKKPTETRSQPTEKPAEKPPTPEPASPEPEILAPEPSTPAVVSPAPTEPESSSEDEAQPEAQPSTPPTTPTPQKTPSSQDSPFRRWRQRLQPKSPQPNMTQPEESAPSEIPAMPASPSRSEEKSPGIESFEDAAAPSASLAPQDVDTAEDSSASEADVMPDAAATAGEEAADNDATMTDTVEDEPLAPSTPTPAVDSDPGKAVQQFLKRFSWPLGNSSEKVPVPGMPAIDQAAPSASDAENQAEDSVESPSSDGTDDLSVEKSADMRPQSSSDALAEPEQAADAIAPAPTLAEPTEAPLGKAAETSSEPSSAEDALDEPASTTQPRSGRDWLKRFQQYRRSPAKPEAVKPEADEPNDIDETLPGTPADVMLPEAESEESPVPEIPTLPEALD